MEPISLFLNSFIQLVERIIYFEKTRREDKQQVFKEIIEPLFVQFQPVAENYIMIFRKAEKEITKTPNKKPSKPLNEILELREKMQSARTVVQTMAFQIYHLYKDETFRNFALAILDFFDISIIGHTPRVGSYSRQLVERIERVMTNHAEMADLIVFIHTSLSALEQHWGEIGRSYAKIKINCLSAPHLVNKPK